MHYCSRDVKDKLFIIFNEKFKKIKGISEKETKNNWYNYLKNIPGVIPIQWPYFSRSKKLQDHVSNEILENSIDLEDPYNMGTYILINKNEIEKILLLGLP